MDEQWVEYDRWVDAVAEVVFPVSDSAGPVYLDLDEDVLEAIGESAKHDGSARDGLRNAVRDLTVEAGTFSLSRLWRAQVEWRRAEDPDRPPPSLPFLALTVLAAEDMGSSDDGHARNSYYPRLCGLLGLSPTRGEVRVEYVRRAEQLWGDLNRWLESLEGARGIPTAYSLSFRYIGLPLSQALVRDGDRRKFPAFFAQYGLPAGSELAPEVLARYLDAWFGSESCAASASLKKLWKKPSAQERIASVAAVELVSWDGVVREGDVQSVGIQHRVGLMAQVHGGFMGRRLDLALTLRATGEDDFADGLEVESSSGEWLPVNFVPAVANIWRTTFTGGIDDASVLEGVVALRSARRPDQVLRHHPRSLVPLVYDEMQAAFVEAERLQLNADSALLVRSEVRGRALLDEVVAVLEACARPGYEVMDTITGLPRGWTLITGVQLFAAPTSTRLNELVPLARDQLTIAGGLRIPSRIRKWSVVAPPEVRAAVESAETLRLVVTRGDDSQAEVLSRSTHGGALVVSLANARLQVGDYQVALFAGDSDAPLQQATLRLRSSDGVDSAWHLAPRLVYELAVPGGPGGALTASELTEHVADVLVDGAVTTGPDEEPARQRVSAGLEPLWAPHVASTQPVTVRVGTPDASSCVVTGAHYLEYPTYRGGWQPRYIDGVCKFCGLVKRSPGWISKGARKKQDAEPTEVDVSSLPRVAPSTGPLWDAALDALMHLGGGSGAALRAVASQIDGSALFASAFPTRLESLGHIALERAATGEVERWEISPSCLVARDEREVELVGHWPDEAVADLLDDLADSGETDAQLVKHAVDGQPTRRFVEGADLEALADVASEGHGEVLASVTDAMLAALPPLSDVALSLPRAPMSGFTRAERFDVGSASWTPTSDVHAPGAYRLARGFENVYVFRSVADVETGLAVRGSAYLVKHLAANQRGVSLVRFLQKSGNAAVPIGCDLPGLYARAVVLASGLLPRTRKLVAGDTSRRALLYGELTQEQADLLVTLLSR